MNLQKILILFKTGTLNIYNFIKDPDSVINHEIGKVSADEYGMFDNKDRELDAVEKT